MTDHSMWRAARASRIFAAVLALSLAGTAGAALAQESAPGPSGQPAATQPSMPPTAAPAVQDGAASPAPAAPSTPAQQAPDTVAPAGPTAMPPIGIPAAPGEPAPLPPAAETTPAPTGTPDAGAPAAGAPASGQTPPGEPTTTPVVEEVSTATLPHDLSPWGMFMAADWVVQGVMIGLVFASFITWTIWLAKALEIALAKRRARSQVRRLETASSLRAAIEDGRRPMRRGPVAALALTAAAESDLSGPLPADGVKERVQVAMQRIEARSGRQISRGTGVLATIGSTAPFVGLFGTVWGIMNSFIGIAETNTTNLAVVAPGIAEALLATGIGLVAAIPAVIIYNVFARSIAGYRAILADGSAAVLRHLSRDLDRRDIGGGGAAYRPAE